jgi:hypothetical protein
MPSPTEIKPMTSETDTATEAEVIVEATQQGAQKRRLVIGVVAGTALLAAVATVAATKSGGSARQNGTADYISKYVDSKTATGCKNWEALNLKLITGTTRSKCDQACHDWNAGKTASHHQCHAYNFLPNNDCNGEGWKRGDLEAGSCYLFRGGCEEEANPCWDYYTIKLPDGTCIDTPPGWKSKHGSGCIEYVDDNWCTISGGYGSGWKPDWKTFAYYDDTNGVSADEACCGCGGGKGGTATATVTTTTTSTTDKRPS